MEWKQIEHWHIKNTVIEVKKIELGLKSRSDIIKANLTEMENRRNYAGIIHQQILLLCTVHPFWMSQSCKRLVYIVEQNKDFDVNRAYILVDKTET